MDLDPEPGVRRVPLDEIVREYEGRSGDLIALDAALEKLGALDPDLVQVVELRFFGGLSVSETASILGRPQRTVERSIQAAKAWLRRELQ